MGCVRKRGKSWNAQVRKSGSRSFTKHLRLNQMQLNGCLFVITVLEI